MHRHSGLHFPGYSNKIEVAKYIYTYVLIVETNL